MYLLDTNVLAAIAPRARATVDEAVAAWIVANSSQLLLSVITAAEIEDGIAKAFRSGATKRATNIAEWWENVVHYYGDRILSIDLATAKIAGKLMDAARAAGISPGFEDVAIAATAIRHGLVVLTRNVKDFAPLGVSHVNPFEGLPSDELLDLSPQ